MSRWLWAIIALVATVASAGRITTFSWDNGTGWPAGTTVELCANGVCANGLMGNQHMLDVPVNTGGVIDAKARSVTQSGQYSEWETLKQTWPDPPINGWARYELKEYSMVSIIQFGVGSTTPTTGTSFVITLASQPAIGNKLLLITNIATNADATRMASVPGFSTDGRSVNANNSMMVLSKTVDVGDGTDYTVSVTGTSEVHSGIMYEISGADNNNFFNAIGIANSIETPSLTPTVVGVLPITAIAYDNTPIPSVSSGWTDVNSIRPPLGYHLTASARQAVGTDTSTSYSAIWVDGFSPVSAVMLVNPASLSSSLFIPSPSKNYAHILVR